MNNNQFSINNLNLKSIIIGKLNRVGMKDIRSLMGKNVHQLQKIDGIGQTSAKAIVKAIEEFDVKDRIYHHIDCRKLIDKHGFHPQVKNPPLSWTEAHLQFQSLFSARKAAEYLSISKNALRRSINKGCTRDLYLIVNYDIDNIPPVHSRSNVFFLKSKLDEIKNDIGTLKEIATSLNVPYQTLKNFNQRGYFKSAKITSMCFIKSRIEKKLPICYQLTSEKRGSNKTPNGVERFELIGSGLQEKVDRYLTHRNEGLPIKLNGELKIGRGFTKKTRADEIKKIISLLFYKILARRAQIEGFEQRVKSSWYRDLTEEELARLSETAETFDIYDFNEDDIRSIKLGVGESTYWANVNRILKPFLWFVLMEKEKELNKDARKKGEYDYAKWNAYQITKRSFEDALDLIPFKKPKPSYRMQKLFLDRLTIIKLYHLIKDTQVSGVRNSEKWCLMLMLGFFTGLRTDEVRLLEIKDFNISKKTGLLKKDKNGYGRLFLPDYKTKGGYSPSPRWGTYIVPELVKLINKYLTNLYARFPDTKGKGYLFRPTDYLYNVSYTTKSAYSSWVTRLKRNHFFDSVLTEEEVHCFHYYNTRHTVAELILRAPVSDPYLREWRKRAAQVHIRHNMELTSGDMIDVGYTREITEEDYFAIIDLALNFPWKLEKDGLK